MSAKMDMQLIGAAGEFLTAGKLFKRRLQVAVTYGNAKSIDLFVSNRTTGRTFVVQVKTQHKKNCFPVKPSAINKDHTYVFVRLNGLSEAEEFFIVPGHEIIASAEKFLRQLSAKANGDHAGHQLWSADSVSRQLAGLR